MCFNKKLLFVSVMTHFITKPNGKRDCILPQIVSEPVKYIGKCLTFFITATQLITSPLQICHFLINRQNISNSTVKKKLIFNTLTVRSQL